jgi:hypothetical protein
VRKIAKFFAASDLQEDLLENSDLQEDPQDLKHMGRTPCHPIKIKRLKKTNKKPANHLAGSLFLKHQAS